MKQQNHWIVGIGLTVGALLAFSGVSARAAEHTRVTNPSALSFEVLGRGVFGSLYFDRVVTDDLAAGIGVGMAGTSGDPAWMIPFYVNYYFARSAGAVFGTAGASVIANNGKLIAQKTSVGGLEFSSLGVMPHFGVGYENRGDFGFLFRIAAYGMIAKNIIPWVGFSMGFAF